MTKRDLDGQFRRFLRCIRDQLFLLRVADIATRFLDWVAISSNSLTGSSFLSKRVYVARKGIAKFRRVNTTVPIRVASIVLATQGLNAEDGQLRRLALGRHEIHTRRVIRSLCLRSDLFIDVGAHIGMYSMIVASQFKEQGVGAVIAFEPHPVNAALLRESVTLNSLGRWITVREEALSDHRGSQDLYEGFNSGMHSLLQAPINTGRRSLVDAVTLDDVWVELGEPPSLIVKLDVEGAEALVLTGAQRG